LATTVNDYLIMISMCPDDRYVGCAAGAALQTGVRLVVRNFVSVWRWKDSFFL